MEDNMRIYEKKALKLEESEKQLHQNIQSIHNKQLELDDKIPTEITNWKNWITEQERESLTKLNKLEDDYNKYMTDFKNRMERESSHNTKLLHLHQKLAEDFENLSLEPKQDLKQQAISLRTKKNF